MSANIECTATRRGRDWVVHAPVYGVYGHGRTLKAAHFDIAEGLALLGVTAEVAITPMMPELEALRSAEAAYATALSEAVKALSLRRATLGDIALTVGVPTRRVKLLLANGRKASEPEGDAGGDPAGLRPSAAPDDGRGA